MKAKLTIQIPIYSCKCVVFVGDEIEKMANSFIRKNNIQIAEIPSGHEVAGFAFGLDTLDFYYIFYSTKDLSINTVSHEICHVVDDVFQDRGVDDKEARAYLTGYITEKVFDFLLKKKLLINKYITQQSPV